MPRHPSLVPFSHDHHEALLVALRLKKGGPSSPHDMLWPTEPAQQAEALVRYAERELLRHFELEENVLFPNASESDEKIAVLIAALLEEHQQMREILTDLTMADISTLPAKLREFGVLLERHIRKEERELFPMIELGVAEGRIVIDHTAIRSGYEEYHS